MFEFFKKAPVTGTKVIIYSLIEAYWKILQAQAKDQWKSLPPELIEAIKDDYKIDLTKVRYADNVRTHDSNTAITFTTEIFFPRPISPLTNKNDLHWLLHEIMHVVQYESVGGFKNFLDNYTIDILKKFLDGKFDVHDHLEYEKEAEQKANEICERVWTVLSKPVLKK